MDTHTPSEELCAYWEQQINAWKHSGLSGARFCRDHELVYHRFVYWRHKLSSRELDSSPLQSASGFVEVRHHADAQVDTGLTLSLPNGLMLKGIQASNVAVVRQLLETL